MGSAASGCVAFAVLMDTSSQLRFKMIPCHMSLKTSLHFARIVGQLVLTRIWRICLLIAQRFLAKFGKSYFESSDDVQGFQFGQDENDQNG